MAEDQTNDDNGIEIGPPDWSQFSRRLASFGLGETPDPLLTIGPLPPKTPAPAPRCGQQTTADVNGITDRQPEDG
jgi:hypothetical protein